MQVLFELIFLDAQCEDLRIKGCSSDVETNSGAVRSVHLATRLAEDEFDSRFAI